MRTTYIRLWDDRVPNVQYHSYNQVYLVVAALVADHMDDPYLKFVSAMSKIYLLHLNILLQMNIEFYV